MPKKRRREGGIPFNQFGEFLKTVIGPLTKGQDGLSRRGWLRDVAQSRLPNRIENVHSVGVHTGGREEGEDVLNTLLQAAVQSDSDVL